MKARILTATILLPLLIVGLLWLPAWSIMLIIAICCALVGYEAAGLAINSFAYGLAENRPQLVFKMKLAVSVLMGLSYSVIYLTDCLGIFFILPLGLASSFVFADIENIVLYVNSLAMAIIYALIPWYAVGQLYSFAPQGKYLFLLFVIVMLSDSFAYFGGLKFGRHSLAPKISPKKTVEGMLCGIFAACVGALIMHMFFVTKFALYELLLVTLLCSIASVVGDLSESAWKRVAGVKDSGTLLPGHGGFLDRFDGLVLAAPTLWLFVTIL